MCSCPRADFGNGPTRSIPMRSKGTSMMGNGMSGEVAWATSSDTWGTPDRSVSHRPPSQASGNGPGHAGWYSSHRGVLPLGERGPSAGPTPSSCAEPPATFFPPPYAGRHNRAGHSPRQSGGEDGALAGCLSPLRHTLGSNSVFSRSSSSLNPAE